jgi:hypothetical protein
MILTGFGTEVELVGRKGRRHVQVRRVSDGVEFAWVIDRLQATGGSEEIQEALARLEPEAEQEEEVPA